MAGDSVEPHTLEHGTDSGAPSSAAKVGLTVPDHGKSKLTLVRVSHVSVKVALTFAPAGGTPKSRSTTVVLKEG